MFLTPARIKDKRVSNFGSKQWMNSKVGLIKVKALVKLQRNNTIEIKQWVWWAQSPQSMGGFTYKAQN